MFAFLYLLLLFMIKYICTVQDHEKAADTLCKLDVPLCAKCQCITISITRACRVVAYCQLS